MKKLTSLLIGCSLALAGAALAQQPVEQQSPPKGKRAPEKAHPAEAQPRPNAAQPHAPGPKQQQGAMKEHGATNAPGTRKEHGATNEPGAEKGQKTHATHESANAPDANLAAKPTGETTTAPGDGKGRKGRTHQESANPPATGADVSGHAAGMPTQVGKEQQIKERKQGGKHPLTEAGAAPPASGGVQQNAQANMGAKAKKPEPQQVQQMKTQ